MNKRTFLSITAIAALSASALSFSMQNPLLGAVNNDNLAEVRFLLRQGTIVDQNSMVAAQNNPEILRILQLARDYDNSQNRTQFLATRRPGIGATQQQIDDYYLLNTRSAFVLPTPTLFGPRNPRTTRGLRRFRDVRFGEDGPKKMPH